VIGAVWVHPVTSRTRKLSTSAPMVLGGRLPGRVGHCQGIIPFCIAIIQFEFKNKPVLEGLFLFIEKVEIFSAPASNKFSIQEKIKNIVGRIGSFHGSRCPGMEFLALVH
jgi:hypothetical protein